MIEKRKHFIINTIYWAIILVIIYLIFKYLVNLVMPFVIALIVAWALRPLSKFFKRKLKKRQRLSLLLSIATVILFYLVIGSLALIVLAKIIGSIADYVATLPALYTQTIEPGLKEFSLNAEEFASRFDPSVVELVEKLLPEIISSVGKGVTNFSMAVVTSVSGYVTKLPSFLLSAVICIIATVFMEISFDAIKCFLKANVPKKVTEIAGYVKKSFVNVILNYGKSYLLIMLFTFVEISIGLLIIGVGKPLLVALLIAVFDLFPIVGAGLVLLPWSIISFIQGRILTGLGLAILYLVVIIMRQIIEPKIIGRQVGLPPLVTIICMFVGTSLFGALGLFGLPITAAIITNMNNDPEVPISFFRKAPKETEEPKPEENTVEIVIKKP
jgi:sporulation integral membrane protein YtvI